MKLSHSYLEEATRRKEINSLKAVIKTLILEIHEGKILIPL